MRTNRMLTAAVMIGVLAIPTAASAGSPRDRATGGGQIMVSSEGGAGDTIAFTAQGEGLDARGQIQYVKRSGGTGQGQTSTHYVVNCLEVEGNMAFISGEARDDAEDEIFIYVADNGQGMMDAADILTVMPVASDDEDARCGVDSSDDEEAALARGNAKVYDATPGTD